MSEPQIPKFEPGAWISPPPGRLIGKGHPAGDFLEAYEWDVLDSDVGYLKIEAGLPMQVRNPRGQLFGGFTPTYVDLVVAVHRPRRHRPAQPGPFLWLATTNMRVDYFEPITGPRFVMESRLRSAADARSSSARASSQDDELAVFALTTMREVALDRPLGDA